MLDPAFIRQNPDQVRRGAADKRVNVDIDAFLELDTRRRKLLTEIEALRADQNAASKAISSASKEDRPAMVERAKTLKADLATREPELEQVEADWRGILLRIPAMPFPEVPVGKDDTENRESRRSAEPPTFDFPALSHLDLCERHGWADFERAARIAGSRTYFLKGDAALLEQAILRLALDLLVARGYQAVVPPVMVRESAMVGTGYFPGGEEQAYTMEKDELYLVGTSEVPVCAMHMDEILESDQLPLRYAGISTCFRREAGTYGKDTKGLYRIHQFQKIEQVIISPADEAQSRTLHAELLGNAEDILRALELPYRVVEVCSGDLGMGQVYKNDLEVWMPSREGWGETHSCSIFLDYQARRLNLRYRSEGGLTFCHTLNNTAIASPRILIPVMEIHQQPDGSVRLPVALRPYMGGREFIGRN